MRLAKKGAYPENVRTLYKTGGASPKNTRLVFLKEEAPESGLVIPSEKSKHAGKGKNRRDAKWLNANRMFK